MPKFKKGDRVRVTKDDSNVPGIPCFWKEGAEGTITRGPDKDGDHMVKFDKGEYHVNVFNGNPFATWFVWEDYLELV